MRLLIRDMLDHPPLYRAWQAPFSKKKMRPILCRGELTTARRVLDVGCGPGINTHHFHRADYYLGIDLNARYVAAARRMYDRDFAVADATAYQHPQCEQFDFILVNSLLHHLDDSGVRAIFSRLRQLLADDGYVHVLDLVVPPRWGPARALAALDRGDFPRPQDTWLSLFCEYFAPIVVEPFSVGSHGLVLWHMLYMKGGRSST